MTPQHTINDEKRGHRATLSPDEPTVYYGLKMPKSLKVWCMYIGPILMRHMLKTLKGYYEQQAKEVEKIWLHRDPTSKIKPTGIMGATDSIKATGKELLD